MIDLLAYVASAIVLIAYFYMTRTGAERPFHWANALCFPPVLASEIVNGSYPPMVLTIAFGVLGWVGVFRTQANDDSIREYVYTTLRHSFCRQWAADTHADPEKIEGAALYWDARAREATDDLLEGV